MTLIEIIITSDLTIQKIKNFHFYITGVFLSLVCIFVIVILLIFKISHVYTWFIHLPPSCHLEHGCLHLEPWRQPFWIMRTETPARQDSVLEET